MAVFRYHTRLLKCDEFELSYYTQDGKKLGFLKLPNSDTKYLLGHHYTEHYIKRYYELKKSKDDKRTTS